jgi:hypothetical protein
MIFKSVFDLKKYNIDVFNSFNVLILKIKNKKIFLNKKYL